MIALMRSARSGGSKPALRNSRATARRPDPRFSHTVRFVRGISTSSSSLAKCELRDDVRGSLNKRVRLISPCKPPGLVTRRRSG